MRVFVVLFCLSLALGDSAWPLCLIVVRLLFVCLFVFCLFVCLFVCFPVTIARCVFVLFVCCRRVYRHENRNLFPNRFPVAPEAGPWLRYPFKTLWGSLTRQSKQVSLFSFIII